MKRKDEEIYIGNNSCVTRKTIKFWVDENVCWADVKEVKKEFNSAFRKNDVAEIKRLIEKYKRK